MTRRRPDLTVLVAVLVPLLVLGAAALTTTEASRAPLAAPEQVALTSTDLVCGGSGPVRVATSEDADGEVQVGRGEAGEPVVVTTGAVAEAGAAAGTALSTRGVLARSLVASRFDAGDGTLAAAECRRPAVEQWFTGVGAGARHRSVIQLVNPDQGRAVVDVELLGRRGPVEADGLVGVAVRGGETRSIDLAEVVPRRDELTAHVTVVRGRVSTTLVDSVRGIGTGRRGEDVLAGQAGPTTSLLLLGLPEGQGPRRLVLANPGDDQVRATLQLVSADSAFTPAGLDEVVLPPRSTTSVRLTDVLADMVDASADDSADETADGAAADRPLAVQVEATAPVTGSLAFFARGDLGSTVPAPPLEGAAALPLPVSSASGARRLLLGGATGPGVALVDTWDDDGAPLPPQRVEVAAGGVASLDLPGAAALVRVEPQRTPVSAVVLTTGADGAVVQRLLQPVRAGLVPSVAAAVP